MSKTQTRRKSPTITHAGITIREIQPEYWMIDFRKSGRSVRKCFRVLDEAKTYAEIIQRQIKNEGLQALDLSGDARTDAVKALGLLDGAFTLESVAHEWKGATDILAGRATLKAAASFWIQENADLSGVTVAKAIDAFMKAKELEGCRETTLAERRYKLNRFADAFDGALRRVKSDSILEWMVEAGWKDETRDGYRRCLRAFFAFGAEQGYIESIPKSLLKKIRTDATLPEVYSTEQVRKLFAVLEESEPEAVAYMALMFFGGLRPGEAQGLTWGQINLPERLVRVLPEISKVRAARLVEMNDALFAWLAHYRKPSGGFGIQDKHTFRRLIQRITPLVGFDWIQDVGRKTFATAHVALNADAGKTASILGHVNGADVLYRHYRGLMTQKEARAYFSTIRPNAAADKIILFGASA